MKRRKRARALWGAGYAGATGEALSKLSVSHPFDRRLAAEDIAGTRAHARGLRRAGLLTAGALARIQKGLKTIEKEIAEGRFRFEDADEDIHLNIERRLIELAGEAGRRVHAGRSRNDQVALDLRLWTLAAIARAGAGLRRLGLALLDRAETFLRERVVVAARTHTRPAQPVLLAHAFHAYVEMLCPRPRPPGRLPPPSGGLAARLRGLRRDDAAPRPGRASRATSDCRRSPPTASTPSPTAISSSSSRPPPRSR